MLIRIDNVQLGVPIGSFDRVQVSVDPEADWVYTERVGDVVQIWSGSKCADCEVRGVRLTRCRLHQNVVSVARQYRIV